MSTGNSTFFFLFSFFNWENHSACAFCWWREVSSQTLTRNILLPTVQYIRVKEWESWRLSSCCSLVAEHWLHAQCPGFNCWWLPTFSLSSNFTSRTSLSPTWGTSSKQLKLALHNIVYFLVKVSSVWLQYHLQKPEGLCSLTRLRMVDVVTVSPARQNQSKAVDRTFYTVASDAM